jgi:hypothetical protein
MEVKEEVKARCIKNLVDTALGNGANVCALNTETGHGSSELIT